MIEPPPSENFEDLANHPLRSNVVSELWDFLRQHRKWWLLPIVFVLLAFGVLVFLSGTGAAPFIYTLY